MRGLEEAKLNEVRAHRTLVEEPGPDVAASDDGKQLGARGDDVAEAGRLGGVVVDVKRLRVIALSERIDFVLG